VTDKRNPTYDLDSFKDTFSTPEALRATTTALRSADALGFDRDGIVAVIQTMQRSQFYKSMTSHVDHKVWQDVYHVPSDVGILYVKFTGSIVTKFMLLSFKEKDDV
jgi:motility quorum-sensing regulator/GCU-specific mRNA interferase toxin